MENNQAKEKLLVEIERLKKELVENKEYGLVWDSERELENVVEMCKEKLPVLKEVKSKEIIIDRNKPINLLIEGDNYHALSVLSYTHKEKIDMIYIDPPYNTEKEGFTYNDKKVDINDGYRHSKWLNFIKKRLILAKNLIKDNGVIFISIDDNEQSNLKLLCDKIFKEKNLIMVGVVNRPSEIATAYSIQKHEYLVCYAKDLKKFTLNGVGKYTISRGTVGNSDQTMPIIEFPAGLSCYNLKDGTYNTTRKIEGSMENIDNLDPILIKNGKLNHSVRLKARWRSSNDMRNFFANQCQPTVAKINGIIEDIYFENNKFNPQIKKSTFEKLSSLILNNSRGSKDLEELGLKGKFDYPKSKDFLKYLFEVVGTRNSTILDFFAGSGTTGHSVLELNKDGGNRKFILCTNNENNICEEVTYLRIQKVLKGYQKNGDGEKVLGLGGNLKYFKTDFVEYNEATDKNKIKLTREAVEMLCIKEETFEMVQDSVGFKIFKNHEHYTGIIFDQLAIKEFKKAIIDIEGKVSIYIFSLGDDSFEEEFEDIKQKVKLSPIPEAILKVYRRIFK